MTFRDLSFREWSRMGEAEAFAAGQAIAKALPHGVTFAGLNVRSGAGRQARIARFRLPSGDAPADFVLVPGGEVRLGFDATTFVPSAGQQDSFSESAEDYGIDQSITEFVDSQTSSPRLAHLSAMLVELEAHDIGNEPIEANDPLYSQLRQRLRGSGRIEFSGGELGGGVMERGRDGVCRAWRRRPATHANIAASLALKGMRLPTCDEWEWACGAGADTLFRWGNDCPTDFYPIGESPEQVRLRREWVRSGAEGEFEAPPAWAEHERPNLFGLKIALNPYHVDVVADGPRTLGGDGGCSICGGAGFFLGWLPLATAFRNPHCHGWSEPDANLADGHCRLRRVIPLP